MIDHVADLHEWLRSKGLTEEQIQNDMGQGTVKLRDIWNLECADPGIYYKRQDVGDAYLFDLTSWHASGSINAWFRGVVEGCEGHHRVLDFGGGIGSYALNLASRGHEVDVLEVNPILSEYIGWRARKHGLEVTVNPAVRAPYDAAICIDTAEHVPHPEELPRELSEMLCPGGRLVMTWTFHQSGGMHPMHHTEGRLVGFLSALNKYFSGPVGDHWPAWFNKR